MSDRPEIVKVLLVDGKENEPGLEWKDLEINLDELTIRVFEGIEGVIDSTFKEFGYSSRIAPLSEIDIPGLRAIGEQIKNKFRKDSAHAIEMYRVLKKRLRRK